MKIKKSVFQCYRIIQRRCYLVSCLGFCFWGFFNHAEHTSKNWLTNISCFQNTKQMDPTNMDNSYILGFVLTAKDTSVSREIKTHKSILCTLPVYLNDTVLC